MKPYLIKFISLVLALLLNGVVVAATVTLKSGEIIQGKIEVEADDHIVVARPNGIFEKISRDKIQEISAEEENTQKKDSAIATEAESFLKSIGFHDLSLYGSLGYKKIDLDDLNASLAGLGYNALPEDYVSLGLGGFFMIDKIVLGGETNVLWREGVNSTLTSGSNIRSSFNALSTLGTAGYLIYNSKYFQIIPYGGLGLSGMNIMLTDTTSTSFDAIAKSPTTGAVLTSLAATLKLGLQINLKIKLITYKGADFGLLGGLKSGYGFSFFNSDWVMGGINDRVSVSGGPSTRLNGIFVQGYLGVWGTL